MNLQETLSNALNGIAIALITYISIFTVNYIKQKTILLKEKVNSDLMGKYIDELNYLIADTVVAVSQTYVDTLKKDKKFNAEEQKEAFERVVGQVKSLASERMVKAVNTIYGDIDNYLALQIEKEVKLQKDLTNK